MFVTIAVFLVYHDLARVHLAEQLNLKSSLNRQPRKLICIEILHKNTCIYIDKPLDESAIHWNVRIRDR